MTAVETHVSKKAQQDATNGVIDEELRHVLPYRRQWLNAQNKMKVTNCYQQLKRNVLYSLI